jgi:hypothetical protein
MKSVHHYSAFIDTYRSRDGTLPSQIPEADEPAFLAASFNLGRVLHRCVPSGYNMNMWVPLTRVVITREDLRG